MSLLALVLLVRQLCLVYIYCFQQEAVFTTFAKMLETVVLE